MTSWSRIGDAKKPFTIREPFWLGRYPVTNSQYALFINDGGYLGFRVAAVPPGRQSSSGRAAEPGA